MQPQLTGSAPNNRVQYIDLSGYVDDPNPQIINLSGEMDVYEFTEAIFLELITCECLESLHASLNFGQHAVFWTPSGRVQYLDRLADVCRSRLNLYMMYNWNNDIPVGYLKSKVNTVHLYRALVYKYKDDSFWNKEFDYTDDVQVKKVLHDFKWQL